MLASLRLVGGLTLKCCLVTYVVGTLPDVTVESDGKHWKVDVNSEYNFGAQRPVTPTVSSEQPTIFIGVSGYRDSERCARTLFFAYTSAKWPEKVHFGVVEQVAKQDPRCLVMYCDFMKKEKPALFLKAGGKCPYRSQIKVTSVDYSESKGPVYARALQGALLGDEEFCMQVDSHSKFMNHWDEAAVKIWKRTENEYAILTTYVHDIGALGQPWADGIVPHVCKTQWGGWGTVRNSQAANADFGSLDKEKRKSIMTISWAAGLSFSKCHLERQVPYDINLKEVFDGEEFSRFARAWTYGYDSYTPSENLVFHDYFKKMGKANHAVWNFDPPKIDQAMRQREEDHSSKRLATLFHMEGGDGQDLGIYGLGKVRTFEQLEEFTGITLTGRNKKASRGERCNTLHWVPYKNVPAALEDFAKGPAPLVLESGSLPVPLDAAAEPVVSDRKPRLRKRRKEKFLTGGL